MARQIVQIVAIGQPGQNSLVALCSDGTLLELHTVEEKSEDLVPIRKHQWVPIEVKMPRE